MRAGPWNAWIETLVPARVRISYFARRTRTNQWGIVAGFLAGGVALQAADRMNIPLAVFAALFFPGGGEPDRLVRPLDHAPRAAAARRAPAMPLASVFRSLSAGENGRLLLYLMAAQAAVQIAGPYFNPFMLGELHFSYTIYAIVTCAATVAKIYCPRSAGSPTAWACGGSSGSARRPACSCPRLAGVEQLDLSGRRTGLLGHGLVRFDLATLLLFIETIPRQKRVDVLAFFNLANSVAMAGGSLWRGGFGSAGGRPRCVSGAFAISTLAPALAIVLLVRMPARSIVREIGRVPAPHFISKLLPRHTSLPGNVHGEPESVVRVQS